MQKSVITFRETPVLNENKLKKKVLHVNKGICQFFLRCFFKLKKLRPPCSGARL